METYHKYEEDLRRLKEYQKIVNDYKKKANEQMLKMCATYPDIVTGAFTNSQNCDLSHAIPNPKTGATCKYQVFIESEKGQPFKEFNNIDEASKFFLRIKEEMKIANPSVNIPKESSARESIRRWCRGKHSCTRFLINGEKVHWKEVFE